MPLTENCKSVVARELIDIIADLTLNLNSLISKVKGDFSASLDDIAKNFAEINKPVINELASDLVEIEARALRLYIEQALGRDIKNAKSLAEAKLEDVRNYVYQIAVLFIGTADLDLVLIDDNIKEFNKYAWEVIQRLTNLRQNFLNIYNLLPAPLSQNYLNSLKSKANVWTDLLLTAYSLLSSLDERKNVAIYFNVNEADRYIDTTIDSMLNSLPPAGFDDYVSTRNLYKIYLELKKMDKELSPLTKAYGMMTVKGDGLLGLESLSETALRAVSFGPLFDRFVIAACKVVAEILLGIINDINNTPVFVVGARLFFWIFELQVLHSVLQALLLPVSQASKRANIEAIGKGFDRFKKSWTDSAADDLLKLFTSLVVNPKTYVSVESLRGSILKIINLIDKELARINNCVNILQDIRNFLPSAEEYVKSVSTLKSLAQKAGIPPERFTVQSISKVMNDVSDAALVAGAGWAFVKCFTDAIQQAKTLQEAQKLQDQATLIKGSSKVENNTGSASTVSMIEGLKNTIESLKEILASTLV